MARVTIKVGDKVRLINPVSVKHFSGVGMKTVGIVEKIDPSCVQGTHVRPYLLRFSDRPGLHAYARDEIRKV